MTRGRNSDPFMLPGVPSMLPGDPSMPSEDSSMLPGLPSLFPGFSLALPALPSMLPIVFGNEQGGRSCAERVGGRGGGRSESSGEGGEKGGGLDQGQGQGAQGGREGAVPSPSTLSPPRLSHQIPEGGPECPPAQPSLPLCPASPPHASPCAPGPPRRRRRPALALILPLLWLSLPLVSAEDDLGITQLDRAIGAPHESNLDLLPLIIAVTVDGHLHALDRETGKWLWTLHDGRGEVGGVPGRVPGGGGDDEGVREARQGQGNPGAGQPPSAAEAAAYAALKGPLVGDRGAREGGRHPFRPLYPSSPGMGDNVAPFPRSDGSFPSPVPPPSPPDTYIVEPIGPGAIFRFSQTGNSPGTLQQLPLTMMDLVALSPFVFPEDASRMFVGRKETKIVGVDLRSGRLVSVLEDDKAWCEWEGDGTERNNMPSGAKGAGGVLEGRGGTREGAKSSGNILSRPGDLLYISRVDYHLAVYDKASSRPLQKLVYTSFSPSSHVPYNATLDGRYIQPLPDGGLVCFLAGMDEIQWSLSFPEPVASIFDVVTSPQSEHALLVPQPQPHENAGMPFSFSAVKARSDSTFIGKVGRELFAMSRDNYPLVNFAAKGYPLLESSGASEGPVCSGDECLVGRHEVERVKSVALSHPLVPPGSLPPLSIDPPTREYKFETGLHLLDAPPRASHRTLIIPLPLYDLQSAFIVGVFSLCLFLYWYISPRVRARKAPGSDGSMQNEIQGKSESGDSPTSNAAVQAEKDVPTSKTVTFADDIPSDNSDTEKTQKKRSRRKRGKKTKKSDGEGLPDNIEIINDPAAGIVPVVAVASDKPPGVVTVGNLVVTPEIIGYGSQGTIVLRGRFQGRSVAVKRLLTDFVTVATREVELLQESDDHPNVVRYFCKEQLDRFLYIALELCPATLSDVIERAPRIATDSHFMSQFDPKKSLRQITSGVRHLHKLKIIHRDLKPQNILVVLGRHKAGLRMLISDFGLCRKLDVDESSFHPTSNYAAGSFGYRAPEVLMGHVDLSGEGLDTPTGSIAAPEQGVGSRTTAEGTRGRGGRGPAPSRLTRSVDIFSLGCIYYYVLTMGDHPYGKHFERETNIYNSRSSLESLDGLGEEAIEAQDLISQMIAFAGESRPSAEKCLLHPFFWDAGKRLAFLCDASDRFEIMTRDPPDPVLRILENDARAIVGDDWQKSINRNVLEDLNKYRKYDGKSVRDLLRVLRNKKNHFQDLPVSARRILGDLPGGFLAYFTSRFPYLLLRVFATVEGELRDERGFEALFRFDEEE